MNKPDLLMQVLEFLDGVIAAHGDSLFVVLVFLSIPLIGWILAGGWRRNRHRRNHHHIIVIRPPEPPQPRGSKDRPTGADDDGDSFAA
jgi:hypothetical protein